MTREDNRTTFYSPSHGYVQLVRRSVGYYTDYIQVQERVGADGWAGEFRIVDKKIKYWRGQLVIDWEGHIEETGERWGFRRGRVVWLNAENFRRITDLDYLAYEATRNTE